MYDNGKKMTVLKYSYSRLEDDGLTHFYDKDNNDLNVLNLREILNLNDKETRRKLLNRLIDEEYKGNSIDPKINRDARDMRHRLGMPYLI